MYTRENGKKIAPVAREHPLLRYKLFIIALQIVVASLSPQVTHSQVDTTLYRSWSAGIAAGDEGYDASLGLEVTSRSILHGRLCLRVRGNVVWMETYKSLYDRWTSYHLMEALAVYQFPIAQRIRPYVEVGLIEVLPSGACSNRTRIEGFACRAGMEMFIVAQTGFHIAYYFAGGFNSVDAYAEKLDTNPRYANGIAFNTGLRFYLKGAR